VREAQVRQVKLNVEKMTMAQLVDARNTARRVAPIDIDEKVTLLRLVELIDVEIARRRHRG
jgi:hypothetical protein